MAIPPRLEAELVDLRIEFAIEDSEDNDFIYLIFKAFPLNNDQFNIQFTNLVLKVPKTYPDAGPDMFWVKPNVTFKDGRFPQAADSFENVLGEQWQRFSWHRPWNPTFDNMHGHVEFIKFRLKKNE